MDAETITKVLKATLDVNQREAAEKHLDEVHKIVNFTPLLLQIIMSEEIEPPVRQAGVIYLKNMVIQFWADREPDVSGDPIPFSIHEQDRATIRENLVEAIIRAPPPIRVQLTVIVSNVLKHDFPARWPTAASKMSSFIESDVADTWLGALLCLYQLVKNFEYKKADERAPLNAVMSSLLPLLHTRCMQLMSDQSEAAVLVQKQILKIFFALIQFCLPQDLITRPVFTSWMELVGQIVNRAIPPSAQEVDEEDRPELVWWKVKKWALHILSRVFDRYGSPGNVTKEYNSFAEWYIKSFSDGIMTVLLQLLDSYRRGEYVAPRVLQLALNYIKSGVSHAIPWKILKPHFQQLIQEVLFPLLCHSDEDQLMWESDPVEYIRVKFDVLEDYISPVMAAESVLHQAAAKRKEVLQKTMGFVVQTLGIAGLDPRKKDGCLHVVGVVADLLVKRKMYKEQAESMIASYVYPEFSNPEGYLRARACKVFHQFSEVRFRQDQTLQEGILGLCRLCVQDKDLPVKVEAAMALQMLITNQEKSVEFLRPHIREIMMEVLKLIRETENDDLTTVLQKLVCTYDDDIAPFALDMTSHLAETFAQVLSSDDNDDEKAITAMGILTTIDSLLTVMEDNRELMVQMEQVVLKVVGVVLENNVMEFYEEMLTLVYSLTCREISQPMWQVFFLLYDLFRKDGFDYFTDMMPALHNYITVNTDAFLSNPRHLEIVYEICKSVLTGDAGEDAECHAAKLLEVIILQCQDHIQPAIPNLVQIAMERLMKEVKTSELRTMCLQVAIAALYVSPELLLGTLEKAQQENGPSLTMQFIQQWLRDSDCFLGLHDRKVSVLGLCKLIESGPSRPGAVSDVSCQILPSALLLFQGLKRAYASRAEAEDSDEEDEGDEEIEDGPLESDESDIDEDQQIYLEKIQKSGAESDDEDEDDDLAEETALENFQTPLDVENSPVDEYLVFKNALAVAQANDRSWYDILMGSLTEDQQHTLKQVIETADKRAAAKESAKIEQSGGYRFNNMAIPTSFNFTTP